MALFQNKIFEKYLQTLDGEQVDAAYATFCSFFHDKDRQRNILQSNEEQFQEGFLRELFVNVLGYTLNPDPNYNLITEQKDSTDSKKADGAILQNEEVIGIIELKDHKTPDLGKVERQAFGYKSQHKNATYVIISNFQKLRFYIDNAVEYVEWDLFKLNREEFAQLWLCLSHECLIGNLPKKIKDESVSTEEQITNKLYKDYISFKRELFNNILKLNITEDGEHNTNEWKVLLFKKTQKLLDRLLFIFFAEDGGLLPPNSIRSIVEQWRMFIENDEDIRLYSRIKKYFGYMNTGYKGKKYEVYAYNGGLFKPDEVLDNLAIDDEILAKNILLLSEYDFASEVDVNILGHIFENSLSEIEEVTAQLEDGQAPSVSKRKKDGVFYTPQYITKYIVENTVGRLCNAKKLELNLREQDYFSDEKRSLNDKKKMLSNLSAYREWLLQLTVCDPACGSGAFLNAALRFLMDEHHQLDEMEASITNSDFVFPGIENVILENNLYGVDINEESVEIARLALWLRTAKPYRKLSSLNSNIKCGNSLISDPAIAGEKAFDWEKEFPQVFAKGGFDVVIGNPPYVNMVNIQESSVRKYYQSNYSTVKNKCDLYNIFTERSYHLLHNDGLLGFIFPNSWMGTESFSLFREFLAKKVRVYQLVELPSGVFEDATVTTILCFYQKTIPTPEDSISIAFCKDTEFHNKDFKLSYRQILNNPNTSFAFERIINLNKKPNIHLGDIACFSLGIKTSDDKRFVFNEKIDDDCHLFLRGRNLFRWGEPLNNEWLWYKPELICEKAGGRPRVYENFVVDKKIVIQDIATCITATIDYKRYLCNDTINIIYSVKDEYDLRYILSLLNSKLVNKWFKKLYPAGLHIKTNQLETIPIPLCLEQKPFILLVDQIMAQTSNIQSLRSRFLRRVTENLGIEKITGALESFDELSFEDFLKELKKQKVKLSLVQQDEWEDYFIQYKQQCHELQYSIYKNETEIDRLVYELYGLTNAEVKTIDPEAETNGEEGELFKA